MATRMERLQQGERFRIIDPPSLPAKPDFPNHLKFWGFGLGAGLVLGVVVAGGVLIVGGRPYIGKKKKELKPGGVYPWNCPAFIYSHHMENERKKKHGWGTAAAPQRSTFSSP